jgi:hypothetical protein
MRGQSYGGACSAGWARPSHPKQVPDEIDEVRWLVILTVDPIGSLYTSIPRRVGTGTKLRFAFGKSPLRQVCRCNLIPGLCDRTTTGC